MSHHGLSPKQQSVLLLAEKFGIDDSEGKYFLTDKEGIEHKVHKGSVKSLMKKGLLVFTDEGMLVPIQMDLDVVDKDIV